ncbi:MAG: 4-hydroxy-3-methylbut-2-enyl diphosphate reductase [Verrucomicrobiota bacterium]
MNWKDRSDTEATMGSALLCLFLGNNKLVLRENSEGRWESLAMGEEGDLVGALESLGIKTKVVEVSPGLHFAAIDDMEVPDSLLGAEAYSLSDLRDRDDLEETLASRLSAIFEASIRIPYLYFRDNDYIYRFRTEKQRNREVYYIDDTSMALYHSALCRAIKELKRVRERSAATPARLDFGAVTYALPSHFGFCLGVQNAIERAYETLAANPSRRVFMLSELIHNPFVNDDLTARGLLYLQSDKGVPAVNPESGRSYWDELNDEDIVIIPAFGARDEDKRKLIERGLPLNQYDATCMLVEKVWKAARRYGQRGYSVVIHGKAEHEETKATFSNSAKYAPSVIIRDRKEAQILANVILAEDLDKKKRLFEPLSDKSSKDFCLETALEKLAVVNQTTLLRNETLGIIELLEEALRKKYGESHVEEHMAMSSKGDTLCYATQVNQDALTKAIEGDVDAAIVVGGKNSSNTFQLFRVCQERFGERAFYIQSEANILSREEVEHFIFPYDPMDPRQGRMEKRAFLPGGNRLKILLTGGASCPDGLLQQVIAKINGYFPDSEVRPVEEVLEEVEGE